jgi:hypothetical protein
MPYSCLAEYRSLRMFRMSAHPRGPGVW